MTPEFIAIVSIGVPILISIFAFGFAGLRELRYTTREIGDVKAELTGEIGKMRAALTSEIGKMGAALKTDMSAMESRMTGKIGDVKSEAGAPRERVEEIAESSELVER